MKGLPSRMGIAFMRSLAPLPLAWVRGLGWLFGWFLYAVVGSRRRVVQVNLALCFPQMSAARRRRLVQRVFARFAQAWLDRGWLWHADPAVVRARLRLTGAVAELEGEEPVILFAPHFVGLDAGATAISQNVPRRYLGIYTNQSNRIVDEWMRAGRARFSDARPVGREEGVRVLVSALRRGEVMYLLPDMDFGTEQSVFVPFYGVAAATVTSLSRFARLGRAKVLPVLTRMTPEGYEVRILPPWKDFPTDDVSADTALMNERLQGYIDQMPDQYYWVHKRFKSRPPGEPEVY